MTDLLQIATGKYLRVVPFHVTHHQRVLYTNADFLHRPVVELQSCNLYPSTHTDQISAVSVRMTERLEAVEPDGRDAFLAATSGDEMLEDLAAVLSFSLNATFSPNHDLVRRLIPATMGEPRRSSPAQILRRTCDYRVAVQRSDVDDLSHFTRQLLALNRRSYEMAIRAIRQVVNACRRVADDPTLSYTMMVAALEALAPRDNAPPVPWDALDGRKRRILDPALQVLQPDEIDRVRSAILEAELAGAKRRFSAFVLNHLTPSYYREGAAEAIRPMSGFDLKKALGRAYNMRSSNVHSLEILRPEAWAFGDRAESVNPTGDGLMLSLEGLNRLSREVIRQFVGRAPTEDSEPFDYRSALPGILHVQLAPQYWISNVEGFTKDSAGRYFEGFVDVLTNAIGHPPGDDPPEDAAPEPRPINADLRQICSKIETLAPGFSGLPRLAMLAIYFLWDRFIVADKRMPQAQTFIDKYGPELESPSMHSFVVACIISEDPPWTTAEFEQLVQDNLVKRPSAKTDPFPNRFRAALAAETAERLAADERRDDAVELLKQAIEELPGNTVLIEAESSYMAGGPLSINLNAIIYGPDASTNDG